MTSNEEWSRINRDLAELAARYDSIKQMWEASDMPTDVMKTPDWQSGWRVLLGWIERHWPERWDPALSPAVRERLVGKRGPHLFALVAPRRAHPAPRRSRRRSDATHSPMVE